MSEWIPIRTQLHKQPKVLRLASLTHRQPAEVVGLLVAFWGWMSEVSADGQVEGVGAEDLAVAAGGDAAFWEAAQAVGWLQITPRGIAMPGFDQWLSRGAKRRIQEVRRRQEERDENPPKGVADRILTASCPHPDRILSASNADDLRSKGGLYNSTSQDIIPPPTPALLKAGGVGVEAAPPEPEPEAPKEPAAGPKPSAKAPDGHKGPTNGSGPATGLPGSDNDALWQIFAEMAPKRLPKVQNLPAYIAKLRTKHATPRDAGYQWPHDELVRRLCHEEPEGDPPANPVRDALIETLREKHPGKLIPGSKGLKVCINGFQGTNGLILWENISLDALQRAIFELTPKAPVIEPARGDDENF